MPSGLYILSIKVTAKRRMCLVC